MFRDDILLGMPNFTDATQFYAVAETCLSRLLDLPDQTATFSQSNLVLRIHLLNPAAELLFDGRQPPLEIFYGECPGEANITLTLEADLLDEIWQGEHDLRKLLFSGQIQSEGNLLRAMPIIDLIHAFSGICANNG